MLGYIFVASGVALFYGSAVVDTYVLGNLPLASKLRKTTEFTFFGGIAMLALGVITL